MRLAGDVTYTPCLALLIFQQCTELEQQAKCRDNSVGVRIQIAIAPQYRNENIASMTMNKPEQANGLL